MESLRVRERRLVQDRRVSDRALRIAIVGAGPAGFYAAGHLLEGPAGTLLDGRRTHLVDRPVEVDVFERLPTPFGLVRHGVAPDHPDKKSVAAMFADVAARAGFRYFGNIVVGMDVNHAELAEWYDAVIYATGAADNARLGLPGEDLPGSLAANEIVGWYNGHPDYGDLAVDMSHHRAIVIGTGNVALDVARILLTPVDTLARTDIADQALKALRDSAIREVVLLGRRTQHDLACNAPELEALGDLPGTDLVVENGDEASGIDALGPAQRRRMEIVQGYAQRGGHGRERRLVFRFHTAPVAIRGDDRVTGLRISHTDNSGEPLTTSGVEEILDTGLVVRAIGYRGSTLPGLPFDTQRGTIPHLDGRVVDDSVIVPGTYVAGWIKRGPRGIIGTNKKCARDTVRALLADAAAGILPTASTLTSMEVESRLRQRNPRLVDWDAWLRLERHELAAGQLAGRPRVKITTYADQLSVAVDAPPRSPLASDLKPTATVVPAQRATPRGLVGTIIDELWSRVSRVGSRR
ncbi:FAD-dependent oxidoreductase [Nocardia sp. NPDC050713]|uniref:FAD-dependent oxidoreductase n=1 Tax=Nocardia sp. NPDC050713 TaxID=3154511 RepID=UPI0033DD9B45